MFERETRREKILEARNKELRLKEKTKGILGLGGGGLMGGGGGGGDVFGKVAASTMKKPGNENGEDAPEAEAAVDPIVKAEREFFEIIKQEQEARLDQRTKKQEPEKDD